MHEQEKRTLPEHQALCIHNGPVGSVQSPPENTRPPRTKASRPDCGADGVSVPAVSRPHFAEQLQEGRCLHPSPESRSGNGTIYKTLKTPQEAVGPGDTRNVQESFGAWGGGASKVKARPSRSFQGGWTYMAKAGPSVCPQLTVSNEPQPPVSLSLLPSGLIAVPLTTHTSLHPSSVGTEANLSETELRLGLHTRVTP